MARRLDKPLRLYVLAIFVTVGYGLLPFVSVYPAIGAFWLFGPRILPFNGSILILYGPDGEAPFILVLISLFLCVFSAASAIFAFLGTKEGRAAALIFVTLDFLWWNLIAILALAGSGDPGQATLQVATQLIFPPLWLAIVWWNFTRPDIQAYYKQQEGLENGSK